MSGFALAPFRADITPPLGHPLLGGLVPPAGAIDDRLEAIGYILFGAGAPIVVCVLDWAALMNDAHQAWVEALAQAAGTMPDRIAVHCVHAHNTPFVCPAAHAFTAAFPDLPPVYQPSFFDACIARVAAAAAAAGRAPVRITHVAHGTAPVAAIASNRRIDRDAAGRVRTMRFSACTDPALRALPEGLIDPELQCVAFYDGHRRVAACHYYAVHPMSYYRDGRVTADFAGLARKRRQAADPGCHHLYFTGCAGNLAAGKYNDGSPAARVALTERLHAAMVAAESALVPAPLERVDWCSTTLLPASPAVPDEQTWRGVLGDSTRPAAERTLAAFRLGWLQRAATGRPLSLARLRLDEVDVLHLPGEMFVEYQLHARALHPRRAVAVAAYGDDGAWYVPTQAELACGGYEASVAFTGEDAEGLFTAAIARLLAR